MENTTSLVRQNPNHLNVTHVTTQIEKSIKCDERYV